MVMGIVNKWIACASRFLCIVLLFSGCSMLRLKRDLNETDRLKGVSGHVVNASGCANPLVLVLWAVEDDPDSISRYWVLPADGRFSFNVVSGRYYLMAFGDANKDGHYQPDSEYAAIYGNASLIDSESSASYENLALKLLPPGVIRLPQSVLEASEEKLDEKFVWQDGMVGEVTTLENPLFCPEIAKLGLWEPLAYLKEYGWKLYFLEEYDPEKTPVLFVHGANGHPGNFGTLINSMDRNRFQPWVMAYPSGARLAKSGNALADMLRRARLQYAFEDLIVVAHSMGGLVSRAGILDYAQDKSRCLVPRYITFSTPWNGHSAVSMGLDYAPVVIPSWYDMLPENPFITALFEQQLPVETEHFLFFSFEGKGGSPFSKENTDGAVAINSQLFVPVQDQAERLIGIADDHMGILSNPVALEKFNLILAEYAKKKLSLD